MAKKLIIRIAVTLIFFAYFANKLNYYLIYYRLSNCDWPELTPSDDQDVLKVMFVTDVHLKTDTLYNISENVLREWQMYWTYTLAKRIFRPQVIMILGDLFDDGINYNDQEFNDLVYKFENIFTFENIPKGVTNLKASEDNIVYFTLHGNHDIGFHSEMSPHLKRRFDRAYNLEDVQQFEINGIRFVSINSVTMEGDSCELCQRAVKQLHEVSEQLCPPEDTTRQCLLNNRPILLTHYPLYRESEEQCGNDWDTRAERHTYEKFIEKNDCLSKNATDLILDSMRPRLAFSGHTHVSCVTNHHDNIPEWTIASFNYRYLYTPTIVLAKFTRTQYGLKKCILTHEMTFFFCDFLLVLVFMFLWFKRLPDLVIRKCVEYYHYANYTIFDNFGNKMPRSILRFRIKQIKPRRYS